MNFASTTRRKIAAAQAQVAQLREQVESLTQDRVTPAVADFAGGARSTATSATRAVRDQVQVASGWVQDQWLIAIMVAAAVGWVIGRVIR
jgi:ElaB/YqjD/DUF883 family membrane-anchored ribosome-binding protein